MKNNRWIGWLIFFGVIIGVNALNYFGVIDLPFWIF